MTSAWNVAVTGMNARPENPGPGYAVARCLREHAAFKGNVIGLGYDVLDAGLYHSHSAASYLLPYPAAGEDALLERLLQIHDEQHFGAVRSRSRCSKQLRENCICWRSIHAFPPGST